jgi:hypothetical protein
MTEKPKLELVDTAPDSVFDDIEALRKIATLKVSRRVVAINVAVGKPKNNVYFQCHPDPALALDASVLVAILPRLRKVTIAVVYSWPGGVVSLWPVPDAGETRIACWKSARAAFELSRAQWVQMTWNSDRRDYDVAVAEGINTEPLWPDDLNLGALLKLGFADKIISTPEHPYVMQLRGLAG